VVDTYGIFDENIEAEKNEIIPLLEEIRAFREGNPEEYKRIKDTPSALWKACSLINAFFSKPISSLICAVG
jgi:hypothetical protein